MSEQCSRAGRGQSRNGNPGDWQKRPKPSYGYFRGQTWCKNVRYSTHLYRRFAAWAVDDGDLAIAEQVGILTVEYYDTEQEVLYRTTPMQLRQHGIHAHWGSNPVIALPLQHWEAKPCSHEERGYKPPKSKGNGQHP